METCPHFSWGKNPSEDKGMYKKIHPLGTQINYSLALDHCHNLTLLTALVFTSEEYV